MGVEFAVVVLCWMLTDDHFDRVGVSLLLFQQIDDLCKRSRRIRQDLQYGADAFEIVRVAFQ